MNRSAPDSADEDLGLVSHFILFSEFRYSRGRLDERRRFCVLVCARQDLTSCWPARCSFSRFIELIVSFNFPWIVWFRNGTSRRMTLNDKNSCVDCKFREPTRRPISKSNYGIIYKMNHARSGFWI